MRPSVRFGLIGGVVFALILVVSNYVLELTTTNYTASVYLKELVLIVSVIAAVKGVRDQDKNTPLELRAGMRAGLSTTIIIAAFIFAFSMSYPYTISEPDFVNANEMGFKEYLKRKPLTDSSEASFNKRVFSYDSAMKVNDIFTAYPNLRLAKAIRPTDAGVDQKLNAMNHTLFLKSREPVFLMKNVFVSYVFPQIVMGFLVAFVSSMMFRSRQQ